MDIATCIILFPLFCYFVIGIISKHFLTNLDIRKSGDRKIGERKIGERAVEDRGAED